MCTFLCLNSAQSIAEMALLKQKAQGLASVQGMYLLLVTNKASNILEDLETLRLMSKVLPEYVLPPVDEESIVGASFNLLFAFDEVISLGYKENVTVGQVKQNTEMESHEEKTAQDDHPVQGPGYQGELQQAPCLIVAMMAIYSSRKHTHGRGVL